MEVSSINREFSYLESYIIGLIEYGFKIVECLAGTQLSQNRACNRVCTSDIISMNYSSKVQKNS